MVLFFSGKMVLGQTPNYLADGSKWRINSVGLSLTAPCWTQGKYVVEIVGDSVIGGLTYKHLIYHGVMSESPINPLPGVICNADYTFSNLYGYVRQVGKKVYSYDLINSVDTLLYDFDLQVGDTLPQTIINSDTAITVTAITNFQVGNETRSVFELSTNLGIAEKWMEGIGHNKGLLGHMQPFEFFESDLICYSRNDTTYYDNGIDGCDLNVGTMELQANIDLKAYPNPSTDFVTIYSDRLSEIQSIKAIDVNGKQQELTFALLAKNEAQLNVKNLATGNFFLRIKLKNGQIAFLQLVKGN
jgi:hypothetical protein